MSHRAGGAVVSEYCIACMQHMQLGLFDEGKRARGKGNGRLPVYNPIAERSPL